LVEIVDKFPRYAQKYTHHPGPYEWKFYYKREALLSKIAERKIKDISSIKLLYSEVIFFFFFFEKKKKQKIQIIHF